jgi:hypothetical protein
MAKSAARPSPDFRRMHRNAHVLALLPAKPRQRQPLRISQGWASLSDFPAFFSASHFS